MVNLDELSVKHGDNDDFKVFLKDLLKEENIKHFITDFNEWISMNRRQLKAFHINTEPTVDFIKWARGKFYAWMFHQYKKTLNNEIGDILCP